MIKNGVYAAGLSVIREDNSLDVTSTINHAQSLIKSGLHGVFLFGSTGQSQLISLSEKKELISKISMSKFKDQFFFGTGVNSVKDNLDIIRYSMEFGFNTFLLMPPAYYKNNTDEGVYNFYAQIIKEVPKIKIVLYNFEKLSGYLFNEKIIKILVDDFPKQIIGCKDSSYNLFETLKIPGFNIFPGSETKLLKGLEQGCSGCISAVTNVTHSLARKVFDDFKKNINQSANDKLISVRKAFDGYNLISGLHSFMSVHNSQFKKLLPPLVSLSDKDKKDLLSKLETLEFLPPKDIAA